MKSLRKSLNGNKEPFRQPISTPLPTLTKASQSVIPPQKVIRALTSHRAQVPQELSFQKGDFFYVLRDVETQGGWYEAHNPLTGGRGLVPRSMFEEINKSPAPIRTSQIGSPGIQTSRPDSGMSMSGNLASPVQSAKHKSFFAVVLHDFVAERADELDAKSGDPIFVVAQSNREWFVAKPIGKLGRPGLIPVAFVEIRDPVTSAPVEDVMSLIESGELPTVEDWKRQVLNYKQNSIALGTLDEVPTNVADSPYAQQGGPNQNYPGPSQPSKGLPPPPPRSDTPTRLPPGILLSADVVSFHEEMNDFWFRIDAVYQPYHPSMSPDQFPPAKQLVLFRVYNDFYDFQVKLLNTFPREAGRKGGSNRILPYMPGPADNVDTVVTAARRVELGEYLLRLCELSFAGARHILEHDVIREFLAVKPGDVESEVPPKYSQIEAVYGDGNMEQMGHRASMGSSTHRGYENQTAEQLARLSLGGGRPEDDHGSDGSEYEDDRQRHQPQGSQSSLALRQQAHAHNHQRNESALGQNYGSSSSRPPPNQYPAQMVASRSNSPPGPSYADPYANQAAPPMTRSTSGRDERSSGYSDHGRKQSLVPSTRVRSPSNANNLTAPPISAANPQTAFIKIKIFDRVTDDLIAIRVHPQITHAELMNKVQARLGGEVKCLRFRDAQTKEIQNLADDDDLVEWLAETEKPVLYAD